MIDQVYRYLSVTFNGRSLECLSLFTLGLRLGVTLAILHPHKAQQLLEALRPNDRQHNISAREECSILKHMIGEDPCQIQPQVTKN